MGKKWSFNKKQIDFVLNCSKEKLIKIFLFFSFNPKKKKKTSIKEHIKTGCKKKKDAYVISKDLKSFYHDNCKHNI